jgi:hypothetical protein
MAKIPSKKDPLVAIGRGRFHPYFGKPGEIQAYSPRELKRAGLQGFSGREFGKRSPLRAYLPPGPHPGMSRAGGKGSLRREINSFHT